MIKSLSLSALIFCYVIAFTSCGKDNAPSPPPETDPGIFTATINGETWKPNLHKAKYYSKWRQLYITASDHRNNYELTLGIDIDSLTVLKTYPLEPHGNNVAEINTPVNWFNSGHNVMDAGGSFLLTQFDTVNKLISGNLVFTCYSKERSEKLVFSSTEIKDIPLSIDDTTLYDGSYATCTVNGAKTTIWKAKDFVGMVSCVTQGVGETLEVHISSILGGYPNHRYIGFRIPLNSNTIGTHPVLPDIPPHIYCGNQKLTARYTIGDYYNGYYATSGNFKITHIDVANRKLKANFDLTLKDTTSRGETISISNGTIVLNDWRGMR